jgi:CHASE2 domain-containing sensor protein
MLPIIKKLQLVLIGIGCSVGIGLGINFLFAKLDRTWDIARPVDLFFYNVFFTPTQEPDSSFIIIDSNDPGSSRSRGDFANMIRQLRSAGAKCIALDFVFYERRGHDAKGERELIQSVRESPEVILAIDFYSQRRPSDTTLVLLDRIVAADDSLCEILVPKVVAERGVDLPFDSLLAVASKIGHINTIGGEEHHFPPVLPFERNCYVSLPVALARCFFAGSSDSVSNHTNGRKASSRRLDWNTVPLDGDGQVLVNFIALEKFRPYPYAWDDAERLLQTTPEKFRGAAVLLVNSAAEPNRNTPLGSYPGWAILASVANQFLVNRHIDTSVLFYPVLWSSFIVAVGLLLFLFIAPRLDKKWRKTRIVFVGGSILFLVLIFILLRYFQIWLGVTIPLLVYNASMLVVRGKYYRLIKAPQYKPFRLAVLERKDDKYPIKVMDAHGGTEEGDLFFPAALLEDKNFCEALHQLKDGPRDNNWEEHEKKLPAYMRTVGDALFRGLFHHDSFQLLKDGVNETRRENKNLRLVLNLDSAELVGLPWELMRSSKLPPGDLALNKRISLVRYLSLAQPFLKSPYRTPLNILVVIAGPRDENLKPLDVEAEKKAIKKALWPLTLGPLSRFIGDVQLHFCENATLDKLREALERGPDVLHYIGHSRFDREEKISYLELETEDGERDSVSADILGNLLYESQVRLAVLNSCEGAAAASHDAFTGCAQKLISVGVPAVVAMQFKIRDETAIQFSKTFYSTLITNFSVETAVARARLNILSGVREDKLGWATPVLFMRMGDAEIFRLEQ